MPAETPQSGPVPDTAAALPGGFVQCDAECSAPARQNGQIWCRPTPGCTAPCQCRLFRLDPGADDPQWEMIAGPMTKVTEDPAMSYRCWCVRPAPGGGGGGARPGISVWLSDIVDARYADFGPEALAEAPVAALLGLSDSDAAALDSAFGVRTIRDLADLRFVRWARSIVALADAEAPAPKACHDIADLKLDLQEFRLERAVPDEDWLLPVARFMDGVRSRHCSGGACATGSCVGRVKSASVDLVSQARDHVVVRIVATIGCECA